MTEAAPARAQKVLVTHALHPEPYERLAAVCRVDMNSDPDPWDAATIREKLTGSDAVITFMTDQITGDLVAACPGLRIVAGALKGADNIDIDACTRHGVWVSVVTDLLTVPTAELAIGLMIGLGRNMLPGDRHIRSGAFRGWRPTYYGTGIQGNTIGLIGLGAIGKAIAARLQGFGARILYYDRNRAVSEEERALGVEMVSLEQLTRQSDFLVVCLPLTKETTHLVNRNLLAGCKQGALLINPARGSVVVESDVADALRRGQLGGYAADVFEMEDLSRVDRPTGIAPDLIAMDERTLLTPHLGSAIHTARKAIEEEAVTNVLAALHGNKPRGAINSVQ